MTEQEFRECLQKNKAMIERISGKKLTPERIEQVVKTVQEEKRMQNSAVQSKEK